MPTLIQSIKNVKSYNNKKKQILKKLLRLKKIKNNSYKYRIEYGDKYAALDWHMVHFDEDLIVGGYHVKYYIPFERKLIDCLMKIVPKSVWDFCKHRRDFRRRIDEKKSEGCIKRYNLELEKIESELSFYTVSMVVHLSK